MFLVVKAKCRGPELKSSHQNDRDKERYPFVENANLTNSLETVRDKM